MTTATSYSAAQGFKALRDFRSAAEAYDSVREPIWNGTATFCPSAEIGRKYTEASENLIQIADFFFAKLSGFTGVIDCLNAQDHGYRPTFHEEGSSDNETAFLAETYDYLAERRGADLRGYRPERAVKPALTLGWIKDTLKARRDAARRDAREIEARFFRSSGNEVYLRSDDGSSDGYCECVGDWNGTLKALRDLAERCIRNGGTTVSLQGVWKCGEDLRDDFDPTDCEWVLDLSAKEVLAIGSKKS